MKKMSKAAALGLGTVLALCIGNPSLGRDGNDQAPVEEPRQIWDRFRASVAPFDYTILKDEIVPSETDPKVRLRRLEFSFTDQKVPVRNTIAGETVWEMSALWHEGVIFIPHDPDLLNRSGRRDKVVIVGSIGGPFHQSFLSNYGDPLAVRTGYPTMVLPTPGSTKENPGREYSQGLLIEYRREHPDLVHHSHFRWAVSFLRALDLMAGVLDVDKSDIRAVIGGHSKRATSAFTAAAIDPERIAGVVFMGNESLHPEDASSPWWAVSPYYTQRFVSCPTLYIGATNEGGYAMFNINKIQSHMSKPWTMEIIPNYRHASESEKQFVDWRMWVSHVFDGRPLARFSDLRHEETEEGTRFFVRIDSPNTMILARIWYVYCDDEPFWRDLVWYPSLLRKQSGDLYEGYVPGKTPDAWLVEVLDTARGFRGYLSTLPQDITHKAVAMRRGQGMPRLWEKKR